MNLVLGQGTYKFLQPSDGLYGMFKYSYVHIVVLLDYNSSISNLKSKFLTSYFREQEDLMPLQIRGMV